MKWEEAGINILYDQGANPPNSGAIMKQELLNTQRMKKSICTTCNGK
jgi:hypothetical protein